MTIEEKIKFEEDWLSKVNLTKENIKIAFAGIRATALEQQPCEDAVSREDVIVSLKSLPNTNPSYVYRADLIDREHALDDIINLPPVTPKYTDEEIQKMQELEQAQLEKAYELGKAESFEEWLSSFNTESAPQCFNAVQELKKQIEKKQNT